jgi:carboxyl-terminal processing protease
MFRKRKVEGETATRRRFSIIRTLIAVALATGIFYLGVAVGQGRIVLGSDAIFHKGVSKDAPLNLDYSSVEQVYDSLRTNYDGQLDVAKLMDGLKTGLVNAAGDPYTVYMNPKDAKAFDNELDGTFSGIGAELGKDAGGNLVVISPLAGFPAEKAGLKAKDVIETINGTTTANRSIDDAVSKIRGDKGTTVTLKVLRNSTQELTIPIVRDTITIPSVNSQILDGSIGYIQITRFSDDTVKLATDAANKFKAANVKGVVLDVRGDPGGLLDAAIGVSSLWLNNKTVLTERRGGVVVQTYDSTGLPVLAGIPTAVLIDGGSASASEITAGALHDNKVATLIGVKSYGKGSVQQLVNFSDGSKLKVTIARWYTPDGKNIDKQGITPDQTVQRADDDIKSGTDPQKDAALQLLNK